MKEALEIADRETVHMSNLVDQLLTLARLDSGHTPSLSKVNLSDIAKEANAVAVKQPLELSRDALRPGVIRRDAAPHETEWRG